jgi:hypothetical protein
VLLRLRGRAASWPWIPVRALRKLNLAATGQTSRHLFFGGYFAPDQDALERAGDELPDAKSTS